MVFEVGWQLARSPGWKVFSQLVEFTQQVQETFRGFHRRTLIENCRTCCGPLLLSFRQLLRLSSGILD